MIDDKDIRMTLTQAMPWWLDDGAAECEFCLQLYHDEAGYHCHDCDRPMCPACAIEIHATRSVVCPACRAAAAETG